MPASTSIEDRIALLLNKAESTTPEEAEALTAAAEKLMLRYGVEQAVIAARRASSGGGVREEIVERPIVFEGSKAGILLAFSYQIARAYGGIQCFKSGSGSQQTLYLVGFAGDVDSVQTLTTSLQLQAITALNAWWKTHAAKEWMDAGQRWRERRQFTLSFATGAARRLADARTEVVAEAAAGTDLVLADRSSLVDDWMQRRYPHLTKGRAGRSRGGSVAAANAGHAAGRRANTGGTAVRGKAAVTA